MRLRDPTHRAYIAVAGSVLEHTGDPSAPWRSIPHITAQSRLTAFMDAGKEALEALNADAAAFYARTATDLSEALGEAGRWARAQQPISRRKAA